MNSSEARKHITLIFSEMICDQKIGKIGSFANRMRKFLHDENTRDATGCDIFECASLISSDQFLTDADHYQRRLRHILNASKNERQRDKIIAKRVA